MSTASVEGLCRATQLTEAEVTKLDAFQLKPSTHSIDAVPGPQKDAKSWSNKHQKLIHKSMILHTLGAAKV